MSLQMVRDGIRFSPERDLVYLFPSVLLNMRTNLLEAKYTPLAEWLTKEGFNEDDLYRAAEAYAKFADSSLNIEDKFQDWGEAWHGSGWEAVPWQLKVAVGFYLGIQMSGTFFNGARDACLGVDNPATESMCEALAASNRMFDVHTLTRFQKWWLRRLRWIRLLFGRRRTIVWKIKGVCDRPAHLSN